ncbi:MAG: 3-hydroxyacyl-ACP dehydratase [Rhodoferax sp.]|nr:MAG: 3-hydroxyacyl-ACP dehydratase [Rhodoferax sp.]
MEIKDYPFTLDRLAIECLLPHRGPIFACEKLVVHGPRSFTGTARWSSDNALIQGHFPGYPIVPGVLLIEAATQLAGAGLVSADAGLKSRFEDRIGVLAAVQRCSFKAPILPDQDVVFEIRCRTVGKTAVQVTAQTLVNGTEAAQLETLMVYAQRLSIRRES